jgi:hypothetical protein
MSEASQKGKTDLTVILPSAGLGVRLGLDRPKELMEVHQEMPIIQFALQHVLEAVKTSEINLKVVLVIRPGKEIVVDYVRNFLPLEVFVKVVYTDPQLMEWPGSIYSASREFSVHNLVLLPDSFLALSKADRLRNEKNKTLLEIAVSCLDRSRLCLGVCKCEDPDILCRLGAVQQNADGWIEKFQDKPDAPDSYNGFWGCFAFHETIADELHDFLIESVKHSNPDYLKQPFYPALGFPLADYADLGTWTSIERFRKRYPVEKLAITPLRGGNVSDP